MGKVFPKDKKFRGVVHAPALVKGESGRQSENESVQDDNEQDKVEPGKNFEIVPDQVVAQVAEGLQIEFLDE